MECWNYAVEHKIITSHLPNSNSSHAIACDELLLGSVQQVP